MKRPSLLSLTMSLTILGTSLLTQIKSTIAVPAPIFQPILQDIRNQLPLNMVIRLPDYLPEVTTEGIKIYAQVRQYSEGYEGGYTGVDFAAHPDCTTTSCGLGHIFVSREEPYQHENNEISENYHQAKPINLKQGVKGYYFYARGGSSGYRHHVIWKQNGLFFEVDFRGLSKEQVIDIAKSMAKESPIRSAR